MGFKKENYTQRGMRLLACIVLTTIWYMPLSGQAIHCPIGVEIEPNEMSQIRSSNKFSQISFPIFTSWQDAENLKTSDDQHANVYLDGFRRSTVLRGSTMGFTLPKGAQVNGIELHIEGHSLGEGIVKDLMIQLTDGFGNPIGENKSNSFLPSNAGWLTTSDTSDVQWRYGGKDDKWGLFLNENVTNTINFGYQIQIRNQSSKPVEISIDNISLIVYYTPLYSICTEHACVPFYIFDDHPNLTYEWYLPQGFELISDSENDAVINIGPSYAGFGTYEICVEAWENDLSAGICCREFNYHECSTGSIGDKVFLDNNASSTYDFNDVGISGVTINLFSADGLYITSTSSDIDGNYLFDGVSPGDYYIQVENDTDMIFITPNIGAENEDSDIDGSNGENTSATFNLAPDQELTSIDIGFAPPFSIGNFVWEDINGDGIQQGDEPGISGIEVLAINNNSLDTTKTITNGLGFYQIDGIVGGSYTILFSAPSQYVATIPNNTNSDLDSDLEIGGAQLNVPMGGIIDSIDAGFYQYGMVGDYVWEDINLNGIQDPSESGIEGITVNLFNVDGSLVSTIASDSAGYYSFDQVAPGEYYITLDVDAIYLPTILAGGDSLVDNNGFLVDGKINSDPFVITSGDQNPSIDFGLVNSPADIGGFVWQDSNGNGIYQQEEALLPGIMVTLFDEFGSPIESTVTNQEGVYLFLDQLPGNYYVVFNTPPGSIITIPNAGPELIDSDITNDFVEGSTDLITLLPNEDIYSVGAGFIPLSTIAGFTWLDENADGTFEISEELLPGTNIDLYSSDGMLVDSTITDVLGFYLFENVLAGDYYLTFESSDTTIFTTPNVGSDDLANSDVTESIDVGSTDIFTILNGMDDFTNSAGYVLKQGDICGEVWLDENTNDIQDITDSLLNGIKIKLFSGSGEIIDSTETNEIGLYEFSSIPSDDYYINFCITPEYEVIETNTGDEDVNNDVVSPYQDGNTSIFTLHPAEKISNIDAGVIPFILMESSIAGLVWYDANGNGIRETTEALLPSIGLQLLDEDLSVIDFLVSEPDGTYIFDTLVAGLYTVQGIPLQGSSATLPLIGIDSTIDNDFFNDEADVFTQVIDLGPSVDTMHIDLGIVSNISIGDFVWEDINNNGQQDTGEEGIGGIMLTLTDQSSNFSFSTMTDPDGLYQFDNIPATQYQVCITVPDTMVIAKTNIGDDATDNDGFSDGCTEYLDFSSLLSVDNIDFGLLNSAMISGQAFIDINGNGQKSSSEQGINDVQVILFNQDGTIAQTTTTAPVNGEDGFYGFPSLLPGDYYLEFIYPMDFIFSYPNVGDDATDSDVTGMFSIGSTDLISVFSNDIIIDIDAGAYLPSTIGDLVWYDTNMDGIQAPGEPGVEGVEVNLYNNAGVLQNTTITNNQGNYTFPTLKQGLYFIEFVIPQQFTISPQDKGGDDSLDSDCDNTGTTPLISLAHGATLLTIDCGISASSFASLRSMVWEDENGDGLYQNTEPGIDDIEVQLYNEQDTMISQTTTNKHGRYAFSEMEEGEYYVKVVADTEFYEFTMMNNGEDDTIDSDVDFDGKSRIFSCDSILSVPNIDAGIYEKAQIVSQLWEDINADGMFNNDEITLENVKVKLHTADGFVISEILSSKLEENVIFDDLIPGVYFMTYNLPEGYIPSPKSSNINLDFENDMSSNDGYSVSPLIQVNSGQVISNIDAATYKGATLHSVAWYDVNQNGLQDDSGELPKDIYATLRNINGTAITTKGINEDGLLTFDKIPLGEYYMEVYGFEALQFTKHFASQEKNSDINGSFGEGTTSLQSFKPYNSYVGIDVGLLNKDAATKLIPQKLATQASSVQREIDAKNFSFDVSPNPAYYAINIDLLDIDSGEIYILNQVKEIVFKGEVKKSTSIDISGYHPGVYFIQVKSNETLKTKKFIKIQ